MYSVKLKRTKNSRYETVKADNWKLSEAVLWAQGYREALKVTPKYYCLDIAIFCGNKKVCDL